MLSANHSFEKHQHPIADDETHVQFQSQGLRHPPVPKKPLEQVNPSMVELDNLSQNNGGSQVFQEFKEKKSLTKKQKYFIALGVFLAIGMIVGGVVAYKVITDQQSEGPQVPSTYPQYQAQIQAGQANNLVELIHVPKSQKIYEYTLVNDQITAQEDSKSSQTKSTVTHQFGLVCVDVSEASFDMILYFIDSKIKGNSEKDISTLTGYPNIKDVQKRFLRNDEEPSASSQDMKDQLENEYGFLNQKELELLKSKGISADQFYSSNLPIIRFTMLKNGVISYVQQPLNIRYDIHQIYLNILEQISPIVIKDFYNISNGKRLLSSSNQKNTQRMLSNEIVEPVYHAEVKQNGQVSAEKSFETLNQRNDNQTRTYTDYNQKSNIQNGALLSSQVSSKFSMEDDLVDENDHSQPLFSKLTLNSNCTIAFVKQEDIMNESFLNTLIEDQENMTILELTWDEAITAYNQVFNVSKQTSKAVNIEESHSGRILEQAKSFGKSVTKPVFRKTYASMEFGADLKSECADSPSGNGDICNVGLYSYFNGESVKLLEKNTTLNISRVLKIYQYINNIMNDKVLVVQEKIQKSVDAVSVALDDILNKVEYTISIEKNPILSQVKSIVQGDSLNIIAQIKQIQSLVQTSLNSVDQILQDPLNVLKNRTYNYLEAKNPALKQKVIEIQSFYMDKYAKIKDFVTKANQNGGLSANLKEQVKFLLDHHTQIIVDLIEEPAKEAMDKIEQAILENSDKIFNNATLIDQFINQNITTMVQNLTNNINLTSLNLPINNIPGFNITEQLSNIIAQINGNDKIKAAISDAVKQVANNTELMNQLKDGLKKTLDTTKNTVIAQLESMKSANPDTSAEDQKRIDDIKAEMNSIIGFGQDIYQDVMEVKKNITEIADKIKNIKASDVKNIAIELSTALLYLPVDMAIKIKDDALKTAEQVKQIGVKVYKDMMQWKDDLAQDSKILLAQAQAVYADVLSFLTKKEFPEDDPKFYQKPLYDDIQDTVAGVKNLMNMKFQNITDKYQRIKSIPAKFQQFVVDLKALYQSTLSFANEIKITVMSSKFDTGLLGQYVTKFVQGTKKQSEDIVLEQLEASVNKPVALMATNALTLQVDQLVNVDLLNTYNQIVSGQEVDVKKIYKQLIADLIANADFKQDFNFPSINLPIEYIYIYPTPIGVAIKLRLAASWNTGIGMSFAFKNATLDFSTKVNTKVIVTGEVSASILIAEVGGYAQGTFLDSSITAGIHLEVMNNYKGNYYFDGSFSPFEVKVGIYYQYYFPSEITKCGGNLQLTAEELAHQGDDIKKSVQTASSSWIKSIFSKVSNAVNCLKSLKITPTRKDLFEPYAIKGETYSKRLAEGTF